MLALSGQRSGKRLPAEDLVLATGHIPHDSFQLPVGRVDQFFSNEYKGHEVSCPYQKEKTNG
jgi:hypothetical protein